MIISILILALCYIVILITAVVRLSTMPAAEQAVSPDETAFQQQAELTAEQVIPKVYAARFRTYH